MLDFILTNGEALLEVVAYVIAAASVVVKLTPAKWDDTLIAHLTKLIALNKEPK